MRKFETFERFSAAEFVDLLNEASERLDGKNPEFTICRDGSLNVAFVSYEEREAVPTREEEEYHCCGECEHFAPKRKADGSLDKRAKKGSCPFAAYPVDRGYVSCEEFTAMMKEILL